MAEDPPDTEADDALGGLSETELAAVRAAEQEEELEELVDDLAAIEEEVDDPEARERLRDAMTRLAALQPPGFGNVIVGYDYRDAAEGLLGSLIFGIPMVVEGGTLEIGAFVAATPSLLAGTVLATLGVVVAILYVAEFQDVRVSEPLLGVVPRRLAGVVTISLVTAAVMLTAWGRIDWAEPRLAVATVAVAWFPMAIGAALGDIVPGS